MGDKKVETYLPAFQIGKYTVMNEEFDRYIKRYKETPWSIYCERSPWGENFLVAWGRKKSVIDLGRLEASFSFIEAGIELARGVLKTAPSLLSPPILGPGGGLSHPAYGAYAVFSDWAQSGGLDPFSLLAGLMQEMWEVRRSCSVVRTVPGTRGRNLGPAFAGDRQPVVRLSWYEAYGFARAAGMRLPTDAEWEKAAGGPEGYDYGTRSGKLAREEAHYDAPSTAAVGSYPPNDYGLYEMSGNVKEWLAYNPSQVNSYSHRGGTWGGERADDVLRVTCRDRYSYPLGCSEWLGFRVAASVSQGSK